MMETLSESACFGGVQGVHRHRSEACGCDMTFGLFLPADSGAPPPLLWFLSGLTCTHENAMVKAGLQRVAAECGVAVVYPDTSPRGEGVADDESYDLGQGAGFYVNATEAPWAAHFQMWDYLADELPGLLGAGFRVDAARQSITGHSMGGHGALTLAMGLPGRFRSVSAFAPISNPTASDWGRRQFHAYLGADESAWAAHDASALMREVGFDGPFLADTGSADPHMDLLGLPAFEEAVAARGQEATLRIQPGYDHGYFFVSSFAEDHVRFHADALGTQ